MYEVSFEGVKRSVDKLTGKPIMLWSDLEGILFEEGANSGQHNKKSSETNHILCRLCSISAMNGFPLHVREPRPIELLGLVETLVGTEQVHVRSCCYCIPQGSSYQHSKQGVKWY